MQQQKQQLTRPRIRSRVEPTNGGLMNPKWRYTPASKTNIRERLTGRQLELKEQ